MVRGRGCDSLIPAAHLMIPANASAMVDEPEKLLFRSGPAERRRGEAVLAALKWPVRPLPPDTRLALVVAHPDDETAGAGGQLARFDAPVIVLITDGAPRDMTWAAQLGFDTRKSYAMARKAELVRALHSLQPGEHRLHFMDYGDQDAVFHIPDIAKSLAKLFSEQRINTVITHAFEGGHPDHDATAFAVHGTCALMRCASYRPPAIIEMPLYHAWGGSVFYQSFCPDETTRAVRCHLGWARKRLKRLALARFVTQKRFLGHFSCDTEIFRLPPAHNFLFVPHRGQTYYEQRKFGITRRQWEQAAAQAAGVFKSKWGL